MSESDVALEIHVAPNGRDGGRGEDSDPLATPAAALAVARRQGAGGCKIVLHGGRYALTEPLRLDARDNGLTVAAAPGEAPVLYGGRLLDAWEPESDGRFWSAPAPGTRSGAWDFRQLYVNGQARSQARLPQTGTWTHDSTFDEPYDPQFDPPPPVEQRSRLVYGKDQLPQGFSLGNAEFVILHAWDDSRARASAHEPTERTLRLDPACTYPPGTYGVRDYYVLNLREGMTEPGQWHLDRDRERVVYWPLPGERPDHCIIEAPVTDSVLTVEGGPDAPVGNITLRGLSADLCGVRLGACGWGAAPFDGAIMLRRVNRCRLESLAIRRAGGQGIKILDADETILDGCDIAHTGASGIVFRDGSNNAIVNTRIRHVGEIYPSACGINAGSWKRSRIAHNKISDCSYCGIGLGGRRDDPLPSENVVEHNHVENVMRDLDDGGCIYLCYSQRGTVVRGNILHGSRGRTGNGHGLYLDIGCDEVACERNLVYDNDNAALHVHMAKRNVIRNNIFVCGSKRGISFLSSAECSFERNIVLGTRRGILFLDPVGARFAGNLYWSVEGAPLFKQSMGTCASQPFPCGAKGEISRFAPLDPVPDIGADPIESAWASATIVPLAADAHGRPTPDCRHAELRLLRQGNLLHARFHIQSPSAEEPVDEATGLWAARHCSLLLKPLPTQNTVVQFGVSPSGQTATLGVAPDARFDWSASVSTLPDGCGWQATLRIPLDELVSTLGGGTRQASFLAYSRYDNPPLEFTGWQALGRDADGAVADPLLVNPAGADFGLRAASPALRMGFVPLDPSMAGPESDEWETDR